ncbi:MAG TPA: hypothetical protein PK876_06870 [Elusimicrobiota bacterium]|nr:hypothetical protein [Elusimicrobiota bacterium]
MMDFSPLFSVPTDFIEAREGRMDFYFLVETTDVLVKRPGCDDSRCCLRPLWPLVDNAYHADEAFEPMDAALHIGSIEQWLIMGTWLPFRLSFDDLTEAGRNLFAFLERIYGKGRVRIETVDDICGCH